MDEKYRKVFVTAHVVVRTAVIFLDSALNRVNHSPEIFKIVTNTEDRLLFRAQANNMAPNQRILNARTPGKVKNGLQCWEQFLCLEHSLTARRP